MNRIAEDLEREERIIDEIVVDAYDEIERALGWYYYLQDKLYCSFKAECIEIRLSSPLLLGEKITVRDLAPVDDCMNEIFVLLVWNGRDLAVPLAQLLPVNADEDMQEAIEDWHYWCARGYRF